VSPPSNKEIAMLLEKDNFSYNFAKRKSNLLKLTVN
jgi:hypothetical protein